ncbi:MAG TPA: DUF4091 domain-containing protein, partial [Tepidisphaeraceae bacterium]|nr:DUF4091 domain-containing protein [Tepidisphaeraceae bacterium]
MIRPFVAAILCLFVAQFAHAELHFWTASSTLKILETDEPKKSPEPVKLSAARREVAAFQLAVRSDQPLREFRVSGEMKGMKLSIWREHYIKTTKEGVRPDPLSPAKQIDLVENVAQPFFIEIEVSADAKPGVCRGKLEIHNHNDVISIPIELTVGDFELPATPSLRTAFGMDGSLFVPFEKVPKQGPEFERMNRKYYEILLDHRVSPFSLPVDLRSPAAKKYLEDPRLTSFIIPYPDKDEDLKSLTDYLRKGGWFSKGYFYVVDEPATQDAYNRLAKAAERLKRVVGPDYKMVSPYAGNPQFKTDKDLYDYLDGNVTIWCYLTSVHFYRTDKLDKIRARGDEIWNYVAWVPHTPYCNFLIGMSAIQHRVLFWQEWKYRTTGLLYWSTDAWANNTGGTMDPWTDMATVKWASKDVFGDGSLLYPGKPVGHDGPLPSLRLKLIRQGMQDYDYIRMASEKAGAEAVDAIVNEQVKSWTEYQQDPGKLEDA